VLTAIAEKQRELGPALDRLDALEISRHHFEAEIQGVLLKADGKLKAANNAEARERQLKKSYERFADPFPEEGDGSPSEAQEGVQQLDAAISEGERLQALRLDVAPNHKAHALNYKWHGTR